MEFRNRPAVKFFAGVTLLALFGPPKADLWPRWEKHDVASAQRIDHGAFNAFLKKYLIAPHPSGVNRVRYATVSPEDRKALRGYLDKLQSVSISSHNRAEQRAYWINLYNALTIDVVLSHYPVESIRDIGISPGLFSRGPWDAKLLAIEGEKLSLNDIEHRILRPIWRDPRLHYAVNCASLGCPNLQPEAYTAGNAEALLEKGAREYINHPRGVSLKNGRLAVSSIYDWFKEDFGPTREALVQHWLRYVDKNLADALKNYSGGLSHAYDWSLNGPEQKLDP
jgi:hypothetical protein